MKPNIVIFLTDQQRHDTLGAYGNPLDITPAFDGWAKEGTLCENAFTPQPICMPARACLQTGAYANQNGCTKNGLPLNNRRNTGMAQYFTAAGYDTGYIGKWHLADTSPVPAEQRYGFKSWLGSNTLEFSSSAYDLVMYNEENQPVRVPGHRIDGVADCAIRYINTPREKPFLLFVSPLEPHGQNNVNAYLAPRFMQQRWQGRWMPPDLATLGGSAHGQMAGYLALVERLDYAFGRIMDALLSLNMLDNTIVLFTSDHGEHFMTRNTTHKMSPHEASIHVPLLLLGPHFSGGRRLSQLVSLVDILPTLMDAAGLEIPEHLAGQSLLPLLRNTTTNWPKEVLIQTSEVELGRTVRTMRWKYGVVAPQKDPLQDAESDMYEERYLYDLQHDPYELTNLIHHSGFDAVKDELRERLLVKMEESGETRPFIKRAELQAQPHGILPQLICPAAETLADAQNPNRYMKPWPKKHTKPREDTQ